MAKVSFSNHAAAIVPKQDRDQLRKFFCDVLGCTMAKEPKELASQGGLEKDIFRMGEDFHIVYLYGDVDDQSEFLRSGRAIYLEVKTENVEEMRGNIVAFGVKVVEIPDPHLYFQAPGGQVFKLVGTNEDLSLYEGNA